jgi:methylamine dehydrogenase light chain
MAKFDHMVERGLRGIARRSSRRGLLAGLGAALAGAGVVPLLPVARAAAAPHAGAAPLPAERSGDPRDPGDMNACDYWRYCAIDGFLCSCCGGSPSKCPPGTEMATLTWIGTCRNPADNRNYIISYNDCCGISSCGRCLCNRNEGDRPMVRPQKNNDINWCVGSESTVYNCSTAVIIGIAPEGGR